MSHHFTAEDTANVLAALAQGDDPEGSDLLKNFIVHKLRSNGMARNVVTTALSQHGSIDDLLAQQKDPTKRGKPTSPFTLPN